MIFGAAPSDTALAPAVAPISHDVALTHLICLAKRQECLIQRNRGITFFGAFLAAGLAIWVFSPKCAK
jgi:hypothetical protein